MTYRITRDGLPVEANNWAAQDWQDLHEAIERVKARVAARHKEAAGSVPRCEKCGWPLAKSKRLGCTPGNCSMRGEMMSDSGRQSGDCKHGNNRHSCVTCRLSRIPKAIEIAVKYGGIDGDHHKAWVIDQMVRALAGDEYAAIVAEAKNGEGGPETYEWNEGIAP